MVGCFEVDCRAALAMTGGGEFEPQRVDALLQLTHFGLLGQGSRNGWDHADFSRSKTVLL